LWGVHQSTYLTKLKKEKENPLLLMKENRKNKVQKNYYVYRLSYQYLLRASPAVFTMTGGGLGTKEQITWTNHYIMGHQSCHIYYTLFGTCTTQPPQTIQFMLSQNNFPGPNWHVLSFLHPIFPVQDHILSTAGDALANERTNERTNVRSFPDSFAGSQV
jgi:hypothetical protein